MRNFALMLMDDLRGRLMNRVQVTTDGHKAYLQAYVQAVEEAFGADNRLQHVDQALRRTPIFTGSRSPLQPVRLRRNPYREDHRQSRSEACQHVPRGAGEPHDADGNETLHEAHKRIEQEARQPCAHGRALCALVQLRPHSQEAAMAAGIETRLWSMEDVVRLVERREDLRP